MESDDNPRGEQRVRKCCATRGEHPDHGKRWNPQHRCRCRAYPTPSDPPDARWG